MRVRVAQPAVIVLDFLSTAIKAGFIEKGLYAYVRKHGKEVLKQNWGKAEFKELIGKVRRQVRRDRRTNEAVPEVVDKNASLDQQADSIYNSLIWYLDQRKETSAHYKLKFAIYEVGYLEGKLITHVYTDVAENMRAWHARGIMIYIYSNAWVRTQKLFMQKTNHGELDSCITGYFDTSDIGDPTEVGSFKKLIHRIDVPAANILFLTKSIAEGNAAKAAGIDSLLVSSLSLNSVLTPLVQVISHSHQMKYYDPQALAEYNRLRSFDELEFEGDPASMAGASQAGGSQAEPGTGSEASRQSSEPDQAGGQAGMMMPPTGSSMGPANGWTASQSGSHADTTGSSSQVRGPGGGEGQISDPPPLEEQGEGSKSSAPTSEQGQ